MFQDTLDLGLETANCLHCVWEVLKYPRMLQDTLDLGLETADCLHCVWDVLKYPRTPRHGTWLFTLYGMSTNILGRSRTLWTWDLRYLGACIIFGMLIAKCPKDSSKIRDYPWQSWIYLV